MPPPESADPRDLPGPGPHGAAPDQPAGPPDQAGPASPAFEPFSSPALRPPPEPMAGHQFEVGSAAAPQPGHGRARPFVIVFAALALVAVAGLITWRLVTGAGPARPATVTADATISVHQLRPGDCLEQTPQGNVPGPVTIVECSQFHEAQVVASEELTGRFPGQQQLADQAKARCESRARPFVSKATLAARGAPAHLTYLAPSAESWDKGDRTLLCLVYAAPPGMAGSLTG